MENILEDPKWSGLVKAISDSAIEWQHKLEPQRCEYFYCCKPSDKTTDAITYLDAQQQRVRIPMHYICSIFFSFNHVIKKNGN